MNAPQHPARAQQGLGAPQSQGNPYYTPNTALQVAQAQQAQAAADKAQAEAAMMQGLGQTVNTDALVSEASGLYQDINAFTAQVDGGVREAEPALQQAHQRLQSILDQVDSNPAIDNQQFQAAMLQSAQPQNQQPMGLE